MVAVYGYFIFYGKETISETISLEEPVAAEEGLRFNVRMQWAGCGW